MQCLANAINMKRYFMNTYTDFHICVNEHFANLIQTDLFLLSSVKSAD
jgi:hypothetical protein